MPDVGVDHMRDVKELGPRIAVIGRSCSSKSTLAHALGEALRFPVHHLDTLHHQPGTNWVPRSADDFTALHKDAIEGEAWVMDGNYSRLMPERFKRATSVIWLDLGVSICLWRYFRRAQPHNQRLGGLTGSTENVSLHMIHHIAVVQSLARSRMARIIQRLELPLVHLRSRAEVAKVQFDWALKITQT